MCGGVFLTNHSTPLMMTSHASGLRLKVWKKKTPPGFSTRAISATTAAGSSTCSKKSIAHTTSNDALSKGKRIASPSK